MRFRFVPPGRAPRGFAGVDHRLRRAGLSLEILNTRLPAEPEIRDRLRPLLQVPRMSTYAIGAIVNHGVRHMPADTAYLNVGVWAGFSLLAGMVGNEDRRVIGVDNFSEFVGGTFGDVRGEFAARFEAVRSPLHEFHDIDYREYFASVHRGPVGFYFYDGEHSYENQLLSLELVEPFLVRGAAVMIDDAFAEAPRQALNDFLASRRDAYEIVFERQPVTKGHPTFWNGIAILARR